MTMSVNFNAGSATSAAPQYKPDLRPAADSSAMTRASRPAPAIAFSGVDPPSTAQTAAISRSMIGTAQEIGTAERAAVTRVEQVSRTLKPYGVAMLPDPAGARQDAAFDADAALP